MLPLADTVCQRKPLLKHTLLDRCGCLNGVHSMSAKPWNASPFDPHPTAIKNSHSTVPQIAMSEQAKKADHLGVPVPNG